MYQRITGENGYERPMRIYPAIHYTMGGLWVNYELMSNVPGLFVIGEANFSDHGANRLGASALMQGLADGYFVLPYTLTHWLADQKPGTLPTNHTEFLKAEAETSERLKKLLNAKGKKTAVEYHRESGKILWEKVGMARTKASCEEALAQLRQLQLEFLHNLAVTGTGEGLNTALERANRVWDFLEFGQLLARDALEREESCGGHFRSEYQYPDGEAKRDDEKFAHVAAWTSNGPDAAPTRNVEELTWDAVKPSVRSYK